MPLAVLRYVSSLFWAILSNSTNPWSKLAKTALAATEDGQGWVNQGTFEEGAKLKGLKAKEEEAVKYLLGPHEWERGPA